LLEEACILTPRLEGAFQCGPYVSSQKGLSPDWKWNNVGFRLLGKAPLQLYRDQLLIDTGRKERLG
jgi:hypothetical protein